jgi:predicted SnoaL-like aldol condensation-catalyzing enzyme
LRLGAAASHNFSIPDGVVSADVVRIADVVLAEHWDVLQDEAACAESKSGLPIFGDRFTD